jgi:alcohol dehydrogenase (cytochrome c)
MAHQTVDKPGTSEIVRNDVDAIPEVEVTMDMVMNSADDPESWLLYGNGPRNHRHSTAETLTRETVGDLSREWSMSLSGEDAEYQGTPLIVPGDPPIMYQTNGPDTLRAINARSGAVLWKWTYEPQSSIGDPPADRGVTIIGDTIYRSTLDLGVMALDRYTGDELWYFNQAKTYRSEQAEGDIDEELAFDRIVGSSSSIPPIPYDDVLMKGSFGADWGVSGWIDGVNRDGSHAWRFSTVPSHRWVGDSWKHGGGTVWQPPAVDPDAGIAVFPTGNPGPDFNGPVRPGPNEYTCGKVALDLESSSEAEYLWDYQESAHDVWDYDSPSPPYIFTAEVDGEERTLASWAGKTAWLFTVDIETGKLVTRSEPFAQQFNMFAFPEKGEMTDWMAPTVLGGTNPQPPAYDPTSRTTIVKGTNQPWKMSWSDPEYEVGSFYLGGSFVPGSAESDVPEYNNMEGVVAGVDPVEGSIKWQTYFENPMWGGSLTTSTGLTILGTSNDSVIIVDTETGEQLWEDEVGVGVGGDPITWYDPGTEKQYVTVQGGGDGPLGGFGTPGDTLVTYSV